MVRRAKLQVDGHVFVLPEQVEGVAEYPFYAKVTSLTTDKVTIRSTGLEDPVTCDIDVEDARLLTVSKVEATRTRQRQLLRQAAWTESAGRFWHGQVVGLDGRLARLQLEDRVVLVEPSRLTPVAPVVALLLLRVPLHASMTRGTLMDMQTTILARILDGSAGVPASNAIPAILDGLIDVSNMPDGQSIQRWIDPRTGETCRFRLQHVVDYAFVVDGSQPAPTALRLSIGPSFCRAPHQPDAGAASTASRDRALSIPHSATSVEQANSIISLFAQDEPTSTSPAEPVSHHFGRPATQAANSTETIPTRPTAAPGTDSSAASTRAGGSGMSLSTSQTTSLDARIIEQLLSHPELLARFVQVISSSSPTRPASTAPEPETSRRLSKYSFAPTAVQVSVHNGITAPAHRGKAPSIFVETVVHAAAVRFQPHPGIIIRLYDFQFGMFGLSIMHFAPFGAHQRMSWLNAGGVNMQNFSAGVSAPRPAAASSMGDLVDAARMLCRYGQVFFAQPVRDVVETLLDFVQQLDGWHSWVTADLPHLVFWINSVLEQFRSLVHSSDGNMHASSLKSIARLSLNDGELQNVMHALSRRSTLDAQRPVIQQRRPPPASILRDQSGQRQPRIPPAIFDLIPTHNGLPVCLRFLSAMGCPSGSSSRCVYGARAHAAPDSLDARVKGHIIQRMGGLSERFSHL